MREGSGCRAGRLHEPRRPGTDDPAHLLPRQRHRGTALRRRGTPDEVGENPPGDEIDGFEIEASEQTPAWSGQGINVREGSVTAKIEYTWAEGTDIPAERMQKLANMVVQRIQQAQNGEPPTASAR